MSEIKGMGWLQDAETEQPYTNIIYFHQLCAFKNISGKHLIRRIEFRNPGKFLSIKYLELSPKQYEIFKKRIPMKQYKEYSVYDLDDVPYPSIAECLMMRIQQPRVFVNDKLDYNSFRTFESDFSL
jgi:hypothetical protein